MEGLTTIHLGGKLGQLFGKRWDLMVSSPAEAIRAIDINLKGKLRAYLSKEGAKKFYKIGVGKKDALIERGELGNRSGRSAIYIMPTAKGANSGGAKAIIGALLVVAAIVAAPFTAGTSLAFIPTVLGTMGASLILGGIAQMLAPTPGFNNNEQGGETRGSNIFGGNASAVTQGGAVGLVYGRALVTPMPVSISFDNKDQTIPGVIPIGEFDETNTNGLIQYTPR